MKTILQEVRWLAVALQKKTAEQVKRKVAEVEVHVPYEPCSLGPQHHSLPKLRGAVRDYIRVALIVIFNYHEAVPGFITKTSSPRTCSGAEV